MIPFDFEYFRPSTLNEAKTIYNKLIGSNKAPVYYGGGTELISMARAGSISFDAVIDIKDIPECKIFGFENDKLIIGSAITLSQISDSKLFPLLCETVSRIADHTIQCKLTIGGNIASTIIYREAALPLMLTNCDVLIMSEKGLINMPLLKVFDGRLKLKKGEFIVQILIDKHWLNSPYNHVKKTKVDKIDYPLITLAAIKKDNKINAAVSGLANYPFILPNNFINDENLDENTKTDYTIDSIRNLIINDLAGSKEYREFVFRNILIQMMNNFKGV